MARKSNSALIVSLGPIEQQILLIRGQRVILAADLARMYGVPVKQLNRAVSRNLTRFPDDFMFQLTWEETRTLRFQIGTLGSARHFRYRPYAFAEHGAVMLASVLNSPIAVEASIQVVRAFVRLRQVLASHEEFSKKLDAIEKKLEGHDESFTAVFQAIRALMDDDHRRRRKPPIGYNTESKRKR